MSSNYNRTILITGGIGGIGRYCAEQIASTEPRTLVVVASRSRPKEVLPHNIQFIQLDLLSRESIRSFVSAWSLGPLFGLVCNAGVNPGPSKPVFSPEGIEICFESNHVGHALLFFLLNSAGHLEPNCRITFLGSGTHDPKEPLIPSTAHWTDAESVAKATQKELQDGNTRYSTAKLGNIMFALILSKRARMSGKSFQITSFDPGFCPGNGSQLTRNQPAVIRFVANNILSNMLWLFSTIGMVVSTPQKSGKALAMLSTGQGGDIAGNGEYYQVTKHGSHVKQSSETSLDPEKQNDLWDWTIKAIARDASEVRKFDRLL